MLEEQRNHLLRVALEEGFLTQAQADEAVMELERPEGAPPFCLLLVEKGWLTGEQVDHLLTCLIRLEDRGPEFGDLMDQGEEMMGEEQFTMACVQFSAAIAKNPQNEKPYWRRARAMLDRRQYGEALEDYTTLLDLTEKQAQAYNWRGVVQAKLGHLDPAIADHRAATEADPTFAKAWFDLGTCHHVKKELPEAIESYSRALDHQPRLVEALNNRAIAHLMNRNLAAAAEDWQTALQIDGKRKTTMINLEAVRRRLGQTS